MRLKFKFFQTMKNPINLKVKTIIGNLIRELRKTRKLSQKQLAERSELHVNTIHLLESGMIEVKMSTIFFLTKGLDISFAKFLNYFSKENLNPVCLF